jgi:hypothetical protein
MPFHRNYRNNRIRHFHGRKFLFQSIPSMGGHHFWQWEKQPMPFQLDMFSMSNRGQSTLANCPGRCGKYICLFEISPKKLSDLKGTFLIIDLYIKMLLPLNPHDPCALQLFGHAAFTADINVPTIKIAKDSSFIVFFSVCLLLISNVDKILKN